MKVAIKKSELDAMISNANFFTEKKDLSSILSHILISAKNGVLEIRATDHETGAIFKSQNIEIKEEGYATANASKISNTVKGLQKDDLVSLETKESTLVIKQGRQRYELPMFNYEDFPKFPAVDDKVKFNINANVFIRGLKQIFPCIDTNNPNYAMNGALIDIKDDYLNLVATDSKRLAIKKLNQKIEKANHEIIVPKKAINALQKLFVNDIEIYYNENIMICSNENFVFFTKLINKKFPSYEKIMPSDFNYIIEIPRDKMIEGIKSVSMLCEISKITLSSSKIKFESISDAQDKANNEIDVELNLTDEISFVIKNKNFFDFLSNIEDEKFTLKFKNSDVMFVVSTSDFMTILVPTQA